MQRELGIESLAEIISALFLLLDANHSIRTAESTWGYDVAFEIRLMKN
jgi:hypothetical protein